ncbi:MAG: Methionine aminopeptidase 1 [Phycisphaerae bacterium]|nr:Methionine aminopeptidase 1 [Phycisphaerae bacterium]
MKRGIILKSSREIEVMRAAGRVVHQVLEQVRAAARPGMTTAQLNDEAERLIAEAGGVALFKGVEAPRARFPFPAALCTSVNEEVVHGVPGDRVLLSGDVLSVDCGVKLNGYCGDSAVTLPIGPITEPNQKLLQVTQETLELAIAEIRPGRRWSEIARQMQEYVERHGFTVVREFVGHGIGQEMHEDPKVPNYYDRFQARSDFELRPGLVLAIEPMVNMGTCDVEYKDLDFWTVVTRDRRWSAHFEHTVAVTEQGAAVLTGGT